MRKGGGGVMNYVLCLSVSLKAHVKRACPRSTHPCPNNCSPSKLYTIKEVCVGVACSDVLFVLQLEQHLKIKGGACPLATIPCPYSDLGCSYEVSHHLSIYMYMYLSIYVLFIYLLPLVSTSGNG